MFSIGFRELVIVLIIFGIPILLIVALLTHKDRSSSCTKPDNEDLNTLTDLADGLERMEGRIANLETILMDQAQKPRSDPEATEDPQTDKRYRKDV